MDSPLRTRKYALEALARLSAHFDITPPALRWSERSRKGHAYWVRNVVSLGWLAWRGLENSLLHEFAHILWFHRYGWMRQAPVRLLWPKTHGDEFKKTLLDVVVFWYDGDASQYAWDTEYPSVAKFGWQHGAVKPKRRNPRWPSRH